MRIPGLTLAILLATSAFAQSARPQFEVASIKPNVSSSEEFSIAPQSHGNFSAMNVTMMRLITTAFRLQSAQVVGGPDWLTSDRFDVVAKGAENATTAEVDLMVRRLLTDRFKLASHTETRDLPIYALTVAKNGPKLDKPENGPCAQFLKDSKPCVNLNEFKNGLVANNVSLPTIASVLGRILGDRVVVDKTGLAGRFDIHVVWTNGTSRPAEEANSSSEYPGSPFVALQEQAGLKLESSRGSVEVLVIDHLEKPSEN